VIGIRRVIFRNNVATTDQANGKQCAPLNILSQRIYTVSQKTSHLWLAITLTYVNGFLIFLAQILPIKEGIKRRFTMPAQITCASALPAKMGNTKIAFLTRCISALSEFNQLLLDFFSLFDSRLILTLLYDSLSIVINAFSLGLFGGIL